MNKEEMYTAINKGIPNMIKLELPVEDLVNYCSENSTEMLTSINNIRNEYEKAITRISGYNKSNHEFFNSLRLITNYKNSNTGIYVSPICFIKRLKKILGVTNEVLDLDNQDILNEFRVRLNTLDSINDIDDLKEQFPNIFEDYKYGLYLMDEIHEQERIDSFKSDITRANYQKYGLDTRFKVFLSNQKMMYHSLVMHAKDIFDYANTNPIELDNFNGLDKDKFELFVAYRYLKYVNDSEENYNKQSAIYYITTYLNELGGRNISIKYKDKEITSISLLKEFRKVLKDNRILKPINEPRSVYNLYHIKHVKNHINKYINGLENWCVLRISSNEILQNQQARLEKIADYNMSHSDTEKRDKKHLILEKYLGMLIRKLNFYENSNYELRLFGIGPFESHVAYFYSNGMVVVDKLYDEALDINPTFNEAIYIMDTNTFLKMISMDKPNLREKANVKRMFHSGYWEERLQREINMPSIKLNNSDILKLENKYYQKQKVRKH